LHGFADEGAIVLLSGNDSKMEWTPIDLHPRLLRKGLDTHHRQVGVGAEVRKEEIHIGPLVLALTERRLHRLSSTHWQEAAPLSSRAEGFPADSPHPQTET